MKSSKPVITICSSASFYKQDLEIAEQLKKQGWRVLLPLTAYIMKRSGNFDVGHYKTWINDAINYKRKTYLMMKHFEKVAKADAVLLVNLEKNGKPGYIGGNGLMEMGLALWQKKPIYLYTKPDETSSFFEEIIGMNPVVIDSDLSKIKLPKRKKTTV